MAMSEFDQDPSANTAGFRAFVERGEEDSAPARRFPVSPAVLVIGAVVIVAIILIVTLA
jgi:hypothetical protein